MALRCADISVSQTCFVSLQPLVPRMYGFYVGDALLECDMNFKVITLRCGNNYSSVFTKKKKKSLWKKLNWLFKLYSIHQSTRAKQLLLGKGGENPEQVASRFVSHWTFLPLLFFPVNWCLKWIYSSWNWVFFFFCEKEVIILGKITF